VTPLQILQRARKRISKGWCKGHYALTSEGVYVQSDSKRATRWCLIGATHTEDMQKTVYDLLLKSAHVEPGLLTRWNDAPRRTKKQVLAVIDKAIALCKREARK